MKTLHKSLLALATFSLIFSSCKKDEEPVDDTIVTYGLDAFLEIDSLQVDAFIDDGLFELGLVYTANTSGTITELGINMPDNDGHTVTLWDMTDTSVVAGVVIYADSGQVAYAPIPSYTVQSGDQFAISVYGTDYFYYTYPGGQDLFPVTAGDFTIEAFGYKTITAKTNTKDDFPDVWENFHYAGVAGFKFEK